MLGDLFRAVVNTATLPLTVVADIVTLGDVGGEERGTFTTRKLEEIAENLDDVTRD